MKKIRLIRSRRKKRKKQKKKKEDDDDQLTPINWSSRAPTTRKIITAPTVKIRFKNQNFISFIHAPIVSH